MSGHAYERTDADGEVLWAYDFPDAGAPGAPSPDADELVRRLALEQALYKALADDVSTTRPGNLRSQVTRHYLALYDQTGATGFEVRLGGRKVGTFGFDKVRAHTKATVQVVDADALDAWEDEDFLRFQERWLRDHMAQVGRAYFEQEGVIPDGMAVVAEEVPDGIKPGGRLRVDPRKVAEAMGPRLGEAVRGLLEGGE